jgi:alpha-glucosidase
VLFGSYYDQALVLDAMTRLRNGYGGDLLWVDSSWLSSEYNDAPKYINFRFDTGQFPDARGMISTLNANHFKFGVWEWPYIDVSNSLYDTGEANHYFIRNSSGDVVDGGGWHGVTFTGQIDFTNPAARAWWKTLNQPLVDMGVEFFKIDTYSTVASGGVLFDGTTSTNNLRRQYHKTVYEVSQSRSGGRGFILAHRQSSPDNDQYPGLWTGDIGSTWTGFAEAMNRASKFNTDTTTAYWTGDTGGYNGGEPSDELYIRWLQFGTFSPINEFFSQKSSKTRFPWKFGTQAQQIFKTYMRLRYRLLPFRYSNAQVAFHESPVKYPVRFVSGRTDEIIVGNGASEILVAPILTAGATSGDAHLPSGKSWIHYWTGSVHAGGSTPTVAAPLDRVPMFVKAGSIIPMGPDLEWVDQHPADPLTLDIYPSGATSYTLYEDDGVSLDYQGGAFSRTVFSCDDAGGNVAVSIAASTGTYAGKLAERTYILKVNKQATDPGSVVRDGSTMTRHGSRAEFDAAAEGWFYDSATDIVWVKFRISTGTATAVTL